MKKYIFIIIGVLTALTASADVTIDNITYVLDDTNKEAKVKTSLNGVAFTDNKVTIPDSITSGETTYVVTGVEAFSNKGAKMELILPKTVKYIKSVKSGIVTLNVPAAVTSISDMTESADLMNFKVDANNATYCDVDGVLFSKNKETLFFMPFGRNSQANLGYTIPDGTKKIGEYAFNKMTNLTTITFPSGLEEICLDAFAYCSGLLSFNLPTGLKKINTGAFYQCKGLQTMIFPEGLEEIGEGAFRECSSLTTVKFGEGLKTIKTIAFASCYALTYVEFPNSLETIEDRAFWRTILNKVVLPENLQTIGWQAFVWANGDNVDYSKHLQSLTIPAKVTSIGEAAFGGGYRWEYDNNNKTAERFSVDTIYVHMSPFVVPGNAFGTRTTNTLVVPKGMRDIYSTTNGWRNSPNVIEGDWEPEYDKSPFVIGSTDLDSDGQQITQGGITYRLYAANREAHLFSELTNYPDESLKLPESVYFRAINYTLTGVEKFKSNRIIDLVLPSTVTSIQTIKSGVATLNVSANVTSITDMTESIDLQNYKVDAANTTYCDVDGVLFSKDKATLFSMPFGRNSQASLGYTIPDGTKKIGEYAFNKMTNLATITFPSGLEEICLDAFAYCSGLRSFTLPEGLKKINQGGFYQCKGLQTMTFPEGLEEIGEGAFRECSSLTTVKFGEGLKTIKTIAFASCYALTYVEFANSIETIEDRAFWRTILNKVVLPENLQTIGWQAFVWANGDNVDYSKHLQSLTIPAKVTKIGEAAFGGGYRWEYDNNNRTAERFSVDTIYVHMAPYVIPTNAFGTRTTNTLVVPKGMRDIYSTTEGWRNSPKVIEGDWEPEYDKSPFIIGNTAIDEGMTVYQDGITYRLYAKEGLQAHLYSDLNNYPNDVINLPEEIYYRGNNYKVTGVEMFKSNRVIDLVLPNTVTTIQTIKSGVKTLNVTATITSISDMHESADLQDFKVAPNNATYCDVDGVLYSKDKKTLLYMPYGRRTQENMSVTIPEGVELISSYAFYKMSNITRLQTNAELQEIGNNAFQGCTSISSLTLTKGLKVIGAYNFAGCTGLGRLTFPEGLEEIKKNAFDGCTNLTRITFGEGLKTIRSYAFASCYALTTVDFANSIETIEGRAFWRTILNKVVLPENLQTLGWQAFVWANGDNVDYSKHLQSLMIPAKVTKIGEAAFGGGYRWEYDNNNRTAERFSVDTIYSCITEPMHISSNSFGNISKTVLKVPRGTKEEYLLWNGWKNFGDRIEEWDAPSPSDQICKTPTFTRDKDTLTIAVNTEGAAIYYTMDGSDPTEQSILYDSSSPIVLTENCTVKAIAVKEGLTNSAIATYKVNWFTVANVEFKWVNMQVELSTKTEGAIIRYTVDGTTPTEKSTAYQGAPLSFSENCLLKAFAMKTNWNNSRVDSFYVDLTSVTCATPTFRRSGKSLVIETATVGGDIYYTMDDTEPTINSTKYDATNPIVPLENCTVRAVVMKEGLRNSEIGVYKLDWFAVSDVVIELVNLQVEMRTATEGAVIRYTIDGKNPTENSAIYTTPLSLPDSTVVKAFAMKEKLTNSPVTTYMVDLKPVTCATPTFRKSGQTLLIETTTIGANIYYTLDGSNPTDQSMKYENGLSLSENGIVRAIAIKEGFINSAISQYVVDWFAVSDVVIKLVNLQVEMHTATEGATIRYTVDGTEPTEKSAIYTMPLTLPDSTNVKAFAMKENLSNSPVTTFMVDLKPVTCATPTFRKSGQNLYIETTTVGAEIHYTLDGSEPTKQSPKYDTSVPLTENCVVRAIVTKDGFVSSAISEYTVDWFTVADVEIAMENLLITMRTATEGAVIRYTWNGEDPNETSAVYQNKPLSFEQGTVVKAMATKEHFNNSAITTYTVDYNAVTCARPTFRMSGKQLIIETTTVGATIYYTMDDTEPTVQSTVYEGPITPTRNCTVKAVAVKDGYRNSLTAAYEVTTFQCEEPTFAVNGTVLTITSATANATIYYGIGENATPQTRYESPVTLTDNQPVRAIARLDGYNDSPVATYTHALITCQPATLKKYDGRYFTLDVPEGAKVYYTLDGTTPTSESDEYTGRTAVNGRCTLKTLATRAWMNDSEVKSYDITYYYNGEMADITNEGELQHSFEWNGTAVPTTLTISGPLNATDLAYIKEKLTTVQHLNLKDATIAGNALPDEAFAGMQMVTFTSPGNINSVGNRILANCPQLAAVVWNSSERLPENTFGEQVNPNMLIYVSNRWYATATSVRNIVVNGTANEIFLSDAEGNNNFYCPQAFKAQKVSYTHNFSMQTEIDKCMGWETIALPFTVQKIAHETKGELTPFKQFEAEGSSENARPFWLRQLTEGGFEDAATIEANTPYIISMPNSSEYAARYNVAGNVTFSADNANIAASDSLYTGSRGSVTLMPTYLRKAASTDIWAINKLQEVEGNAPGSMFVPGLREVRPFEAYATNSAHNAPRFLSILELGGNTTGIYDVMKVKGWLSGNKVKVYTLSGTLVTSGQNEDEVVKRLPKGVYIINGKKTIVK